MLLFLKDKKVYETVLEYRGSNYGWEAKDFHDWADYKDWTVSLFKILDGDCVGGFTTDSWHGRGDSLPFYVSIIEAPPCSVLFKLYGISRWEESVATVKGIQLDAKA
jgi:hypothetical protein